ncbi:hypothetical protein HR08_01150 [Porphyromonas gulae]|uniref:HEAT repeat protein n=2 Tax=Porphyromonas gulae TaxID=111105 RepID=A0A0A2FD23_9PORP|nr:hypothetical protein HR08_01150 [Porphyromonas gulae]
MNACQGRDIPLEIIEKGLKDSDWRVRQAAMNACQGRDIPLEIIEKWLKDSDCDVRQAAMNACQGRDIPLEIIEKGLKDSDCDVRQAAMNACQGRDIPLEIIEKWLKDSDWRFRQAAMKISKERGMEFAATRTIDPPKEVYKKCIGGVIVVAEIPENAHIRGRYNGKCRASEAVIKDIIGDIQGERIGVSIYDTKTMYEVGDHIIIDNFDMSDDECSTGFHFFCTKEEADRF